MKQSRIITLGALLVACSQQMPLHGNFFVGIKNLLVGNNFHTLQAGQAYRSATMGSKSLSRAIRKHGIKTVVNLRGIHTNQRWWRTEAAVLKRLGVTFYNLPFSAQTLPSKENMQALLTIFERAPRPILIHCQAGADRTSMASAFWQITQQGFSPQKALAQLSDSYGHFSSRYPAPTHFIKHLPTTGADAVRRFIRLKYDPVTMANGNTKLIPAPVAIPVGVA